MGYEDADFFAYGAATQLPLIGLAVPVKSFFYVAPVLVAALYSYLHIHLMALWDELADAPARIDGHPLADRVYPWLITHAALSYRQRKRNDDCTGPRPLGWLVIAISLFFSWALGPVVLGLIWWRSMPAHDEWLTLWIGVCFWVAALVGWAGFRAARARMMGMTRTEIARLRWYRGAIFGAAAVLLACLSWVRTEGGFENYAEQIQELGNWTGMPRVAASVNATLPTTATIADRTKLRWLNLYPADLREAELTRKPPDWLPWNIWHDDFEEKFRRRMGIELGSELTGEKKSAFDKEAKERYREYIDKFEAPDLGGVDLRSAKMVGAFLPGADLRKARMQRVDLRDAQIQGANLTEAHLQWADLSSAHVQGANLRSAQMQGVKLISAHMQWADLSEALMREADLEWAQMEGATLYGTQLQAADLGNVQMQGANLSVAKMQGANLVGAEMQGAGLSWARMDEADLRGANLQGATLYLTQMQMADLGHGQMQGANFERAEMQGANLSEADMQGAYLSKVQIQHSDCAGTIFDGVPAHGGDLTCQNLTQAQLNGVIGDVETRLPPGLYIWSCWQIAPEILEQTLATLHESLRGQARADWLCDGRAREKIDPPD